MRLVKSVILAAIIFTISWFSSQAEGWAGEGKIGYINVSKVFDEYKKTQESEAILEKATKEKQAERDKMVNEVRRFKDELDLLSEEGRLKKQVLIDEKVQKLRDFDRETKRYLGGKREQMIGELLKEIDKVVKEYGEKQGYDLILNDNVLLYKTEALDLTEEILTILNSAPKKR